MCGILVQHGDEPFHHKQLEALRRRGPDAVGYWINRDIALAHARLSILGLDERGTEPIENDTHVLAYNGEIYNYLDVNRQLESASIHPRWSGDTETLLQAWSTWGDKSLESLEGFWAFVVYDKRAKILTLVRDPLGVKPLYYLHQNDTFLAASTIASLLALTQKRPGLDFVGLSEYAQYQLTFGSRTFLAGVHRVMPGEIVTYDLASNTLSKRIYAAPFAQPGEQGSIDDTWIAETRSIMAEACRASRVGDVPFTTTCSGGIDSSLVTRWTSPEVAYHANYSDPECNETFYAQEVARGIGTRLMVVNAREDFDLVAAVESLIADVDDPCAGSVILPLDDLLAQVKRRYKILLTGTGGDELFGGYTRYALALGHCPQDSYRSAHARLMALASPLDRFESFHAKGDTSWYKFYDSAARKNFLNALGDGDPLEAMLRFDRTVFLHGLLTLDDRMTGRHGIEGRPSLLHPRIVKRIAELSAKTVVRPTDLKWLGRAIGYGVLPEDVLGRQDKMGFTTPIGTFVANNASRIREAIQASPFRDLYDLSRVRFTAESKWSRDVFGLLMLDCWLRRYSAR
ncbi:MAG: Asparagine synthetase [Parcubacteria group bacterium GW2011_GWB1_56_8]|nr:MAG: Asparagine synthetase [Parcubacteria group bacterium GW2011_GWB1_56_8]